MCYSTISVAAAFPSRFRRVSAAFPSRGSVVDPRRRVSFPRFCPAPMWSVRVGVEGWCGNSPMDKKSVTRRPLLPWCFRKKVFVALSLSLLVERERESCCPATLVVVRGFIRVRSP